MRILLYNWAPLHDFNLGGGVSVYLRNTIKGLAEFYPKAEIYFLCSGRYCDCDDPSIRYEEIDIGWGDLCRTFTMVNSPVLSPAYISFCRTQVVLEDKKLAEAFRQFLLAEGPFDVVHFHNLEGLSLACLDVKQDFKETKFIYSFHNYHAFCPQVNFWWQESALCTEKNTGPHCLGCMVTHVPAEKVRQKMSMTYELLKNYSKEREVEFKKRGEELDKLYFEIENSPMEPEAERQLGLVLARYRREVVAALNKNIDVFVAVSKCTRQIVTEMGIDTDRLLISYIGTDIERGLDEIPCVDSLNVIYMGYQRYDKGFFFLMEALNALDEETARRIDVCLAAGAGKILWELDTKKFKSFRLIDGYQREEIPNLLRDRNLGLVPHLWEDNLPQTALEMVAFGVPILCSDRGGARELGGGDERFVFTAGDVKSFARKITYFANRPEKTWEYFRDYAGVASVKSHVDELMRVYSDNLKW